jgi:hypothetical protein
MSQRVGDGFNAVVLKTETSALARHLLFLIATLIAVTLIGYHYGTFDQAVHIPFLAKTGDPSLYPNDPFLNMRFQHYSFFWALFLPFQQIHLLEIAMLVAHLVFTYCTFWALWDLSEVLFHQTLTSFVTVLVFIVPHITFGGFPIIEFSVLNRTAVLPFLLWAVVLYLRRRSLWMFALLGVLFNFHILSVNFILAMIGFDMLYRRQWKNLLQGGLIFLIFAAPILIWRAVDSHPLGLALNMEWFKAVTDTVLSNLFYLFEPQPFILFVTLSGFASVSLFFIARPGVESEHTESMSRFVVIGLVIVGVQIVSVLYPLTFVMQLQIVRAGIPATIFAMIYFTHYLVSQVRSKMLIGALIISPSAIFPLIVWAIRSRIAKPRFFDAVAGALMGMVFMVFVSAGWVLGLWQPGFYPYGATGNWRDVADWAQANTPVEAVFITPPQMMGFYTPDWRAFSKRSTVASMSDMLEIAIVPAGLDAWQERFEAVAPGARAQFRGDYFENLGITKNAYDSLTPAQITAIAQRYGASYLVSDQPGAYDFPVVYKNADFTVYEIGR